MCTSCKEYWDKQQVKDWEEIKKNLIKLYEEHKNGYNANSDRRHRDSSQ